MVARRPFGDQENNLAIVQTRGGIGSDKGHGNGAAEKQMDLRQTSG